MKTHEVNINNFVVYDLSRSPITFDFVHFLAYARLSLACTTGDARFFLSIFADRWRNVTPREVQYSLSDRLWRLHNLIIPICGVTPALSGFEIILSDHPRTAPVDGRVVVHCENANYMMRSLLDMFHRSGFDPHLFAAPEIAIQRAKSLFCEADKPLILALRKSTFEEERNTPTQLIRGITEELTSAGFSVFLIPDQESYLSREELQHNATVLYEAAYNLPLRLALHEQAAVSICSGGGPTMFVSLAVTKPNIIVVNPMQPDIRISSPEFLSAQGYDVGNEQPLPWIPKNQMWLWDPESSAETICEAALSLLNR